MMRTALLLLAGILVGEFAQATAQAAAMLRTSVIVEADVVRLGDLFDNVGEKADVVVLHAPAPGHRVTVDADWLQGVSTRNDLGWHPDDAFAQAVIRRDGVSISREQIESTMMTALTAAGAEAESQIGWETRALQMVVPVGGSSQISVRDLSYDKQSQHFAAVLEYKGDGDETTRLPVSGKLYPTVDVPVVGHTLQKGEVIMAQDLSWIRVRLAAVRRDVLTDADQIIGMTPRQTLRINQMVSSTEIQRPIAVARGATVTMILKYGAMLLSAQGRAIDQGSMGDVIHLTNTHSNMTVEGVIDGPNRVTVSLVSSLALAN
jgi:flagella basal body P-ring formation protein FlgA